MDLPKAKPLTEILAAADARGRTEEAIREVKAILTKQQDDQNTIRAGAINLLFVRANQLGRDHLTPTDMRRFDIAVGAIMREPAKDEALDMSLISRIAPQTQDADPAPDVLVAIERELARES